MNKTHEIPQTGSMLRWPNADMPQGMPRWPQGRMPSADMPRWPVSREAADMPQSPRWPR